MNLYIMRHGIAVDTAAWDKSDSTRPLTLEGVDRTRKVIAKLVADGALKVDAIWSSPLTRARQTAEIAAEALGLPVTIVEPLQCGADVRDLIDYAKKHPMPARLLTTGHEPDCGMMLADLLGSKKHDLAFKRAEIAQVEGEFVSGGMKLIWKYAPKDVLGA